MLTNSKSKKVRMLRLIPAMLVTAALLMSQVSLAQKPKNVSQKVENQPVVESNTTPQNVLYIIDGEKFEGDINTINPNNIVSTTVLKRGGEAAKEYIEKYGGKEDAEVILISMKDGSLPKTAVYIVDGKVVDAQFVKNISTNEIRSTTVWTGEGVSAELIKKYGEKAKNGVIEIALKTPEQKRIEAERLKQGTSDEIFPQPEVMPEFKGGQNELMEFLAKNVNYPKIAQENGVDGKIHIRFVIEKDGSVSNLEWLSTNLERKKMKEAVKALEEEAMRVVKLTSGKWKAGQNDGKPVRCEFILPITFVLK